MFTVLHSGLKRWKGRPPGHFESILVFNLVFDIFQVSEEEKKFTREKIRKIISENCQIKIVENCRKIEIARKHRKYKEMMKIKIIDTGGCPIMPKGVKNGQTHFTPLL